MTEYSKFNFVYRMQRWMDSVPGQTFLNYAYSWGASIVILGTLFKLTHLPGANFMLFLGMGTEVVVFFISAFDRPFDKTADGRELPSHLEEDSQPISEKAQIVPEKRPDYTVVQPQLQAEKALFVPQMTTDEADALHQAQDSYVQELQKLVETLGKVNDQSARLSRDSEEMENLNRTLTGITKVYEMQLKGASKQINTIDKINEQSSEMARQIEQLNKIYARMIDAMTVNMGTSVPGNAPAQRQEGL